MIKQISNAIYLHVLHSFETKVCFQPIVSISKCASIGQESLLRASYNGESIPPDLLFSYSAKINEVARLDFMCQQLALSDYSKSGQDTLLFINMETSLLEYYLENAAEIVMQIDALQIERTKIVIEINEKKATNDSLLLELVNLYRHYGFVIALDDVGAGYSNLNRIVLARPDIIKIDRSVISEVQYNFYKQEVIKAISDLGQKIGAITIAEGVETEPEVVTCVECGVDWFQGYYFSPAIASDKVIELDFREKCSKISESYQKKFISEMSRYTNMIAVRKKLFERLESFSLKITFDKTHDALLDFLCNNSELECIYLIDQFGIQITETLFQPESYFRNRTMFSPMKKGDNHVSKPFFNYAVHHPDKIYISDKYISLATGNYCQTFSRMLSPEGYDPFILCADFKMY